ncbi:MAG: hypothetical protein LBU85_05210 [Treponema sp.]|jgi:hypothetical protein|nr:hypothetical protein [Treponema sp.]
MAKEQKNPGNVISNLFSWLPVKLPGVKKNSAALDGKNGNPELKLIFFIIDWNQVKAISGIFEKQNVGFHFFSKGRGTASSEILDLLGIGASGKAVVFCLELPQMVPVLMKEVRNKIGFNNPGAGIAFTVPLSAINSPILRVFKQAVLNNEALGNISDGSGEDKRRTGVDRRRFHNDRRNPYYLLLTIVNQGYSDEIMNTARKAGAGGGTVLNARSQAHEGTFKYFGISVQKERELIIILTAGREKVPIMQAISEAYGLNSKAQGIMFSLPVEKVMGLSFE